MTSSQISDRIRRAASALRIIRPAYSGILDFYEAVFIAQEESKAQISPDPILIPDSMLSLRLKEKLPLISMTDFKTDYPAAEALFRKFIELAKQNHLPIAENLPDAADIPLQSLSDALLNQDQNYLQKISDVFALELQTLVFLVHNSLKPSLLICAEQLSSYLNKDSEWEKGYCPICGNLPCLSFFKDDGGRFLLCGFCDYQWQSFRIYCPFCENKEAQTLGYFYSEEEREYRTDICHKCKRYIKTIDTRQLQRFFYPRLEEIVMLHLDIQVNDKEEIYVQ